MMRDGRVRPWMILMLSFCVLATMAVTARSGPPRRRSGPIPLETSGPRPGRLDPGRRTAHRPGGHLGFEPGALLVAEGMQTFRYDTFGDEAFWGGALRLH